MIAQINGLPLTPNIRSFIPSAAGSRVARGRSQAMLVVVLFSDRMPSRLGMVFLGIVYNTVLSSHIRYAVLKIYDSTV